MAGEGIFKRRGSSESESVGARVGRERTMGALGWARRMRGGKLDRRGEGSFALYLVWVS